MNGFILEKRFATVFDVPISLPQTELRRGKFITCGQVKLSLGQTMRVRCFNIHLISILTPNSNPLIFSTSPGLVSGGIYTGPMVCSGTIVSRSAPGIDSLEMFDYRDYATPGVYSFIVSNNTANIDLTVALTGVAKIIIL